MTNDEADIDANVNDIVAWRPPPDVAVVKKPGNNVILNDGKWSNGNQWRIDNEMMAAWPSMTVNEVTQHQPKAVMLSETAYVCDNRRPGNDGHYYW